MSSKQQPIAFDQLQKLVRAGILSKIDEFELEDVLSGADEQRVKLHKQELRKLQITFINEGEEVNGG